MASNSRLDRGATGFGVVLAAVASLPLAAIVVALWTRGWVPTGDDAIIAWRSFDVLAGRGPLVGHVNQAGAFSTVYDPGPLQEWVLAVPVRLVPGGMGGVVGAMVVDIAAVTTVAMAVSRSIGRLTAVVVIAGSLLGAWSAAAVLSDPVWNPFAALVPFAATLVLAWVVAAGSLGWWPVVVGFASYSAQCHLIYAPAAIAVVVLAPIVGISVRRRRHRVGVGWRWAVIGAGVGVVLWSAPLWQQLTGHPGNLAAIWDATVGAHQPTIGWWAALDQLGRGMGPLPAWLRPPGGDPLGLGLLVLRGGQGWSIAALGLLVGLAVLAGVRRRPEVVALALVALVADVGGLVSLAGTPVAKDLVLSYTTWIIWPLGMLTWFAVGWGAYRLTVGELDAGAAFMTGSRLPRAGVVIVAAGSLLVSVVVGTSVGRWDARDRSSTRADGQVAVAIAHLATSSGLPGRRLRIEVDDELAFELGPAVAYQLVVAGWQPTLSGLGDQLAPENRARPGDAVLFVEPTPVAPPGTRGLGVVTAHDPDGSRQRWTVSYRPARSG